MPPFPSAVPFSICPFSIASHPPVSVQSESFGIREKEKLLMIKCWYDGPNGYPCCDVGEVNHNMALFLMSNVQGSSQDCQKSRERLSLVQNGTLPQFRGTGNAYTCTITPEDVVLEPLWDEEQGIGHVTHEQFLECLNAWDKFRNPPPEE